MEGEPEAGNKVSTGTEWINAPSALALVVKVTRDEPAAKRFLTETLRAGKIRSKTQTLLRQIDFGDIPTLDDARRHKDKIPTPDAEAYLNIAQGFWSGGNRTADGKLMWSWKRGVFCSFEARNTTLITRPSDGFISTPVRDRFVAYDVQFSASDIENAVDSNKTRLFKAPTKQVMREKKKSVTYWDWDKIKKPFMASAQAGLLDQFLGLKSGWIRGSLKELEARIRQEAERVHPELIDKEFNISSVRRHAHKLIDLSEEVRQAKLAGSEPNEPSELDRPI